MNFVLNSLYCINNNEKDKRFLTKQTLFTQEKTCAVSFKEFIAQGSPLAFVIEKY